MSLSKVLGVERAEPRPREGHDFYPTEPDATHALLLAEEQRLRSFRAVWEPCVGEGHIARVLMDAGLTVTGSDLVDRGHPGTVVGNALTFEAPLGDAIVTNPPFGSGFPEKLARHARRLKISYVALLLSSNYFHTDRGAALWASHPPAVHYALTWRPDFTGEGSPVQCMSWFVWDAARAGCRFALLRRPRQPTGEMTLPLFSDEGEGHGR